MKTIKILLVGVLAFISLPALAAIIEVKDGESIQEAVNQAVTGDTIKVYPGTYHEAVYIDKDGITVSGVVEQNEWPVMDGEKVLNDAILYSGNDITIEWLKIVDYKGNAIMGQAGNNFIIRYNWIDDTGVYGIFPQYGKNGLIANNKIRGIEDAAIYVGMCDHVDVIANEVFDSVAGIEIENSRHALVEGNYAYDNTGGVLVFITPGLPIKTTYDVIVRDNFIINNNTPNFGAPGSIVSTIPAGSGIVIVAADDVRIEGNFITGNNTAGIIVADLNYMGGVTKDKESEPNPDRLSVLNNFMSDNGNDAVTEVKALMMATSFTTTGPDIVAVGTGEESDNCILDRRPYRAAGIDNWSDCEIETSREVASFMLPGGAPARSTEGMDKDKLLYRGICAGCHGYDVRMIGPATVTIQALYGDDVEALAKYIEKPVKKRPDYPEMPPQGHLSEELRLEVARYMLNLNK